MSALDVFFIHTVSVETYQGRTPSGESYAAAQDVQGFLDQGIVVQSSSNGFGTGGGAESLELVEKSVFYTSLDNAALFKPQSRVTTPNGDVVMVTAVNPRDGGQSVLSAVSHLEVRLS